MDRLVEGTVQRALDKEEDLPEGAVDEDDEDLTPQDIEHEQIYYLLTDAYPDEFDNPEDARDKIHSVLDIDETEEKEGVEGETFYSEINDNEVTVEEVSDDKVMVSGEDGHEWWERMEDVRDKIEDGAWDEKDEDPCWEGYEQEGMKEGDDGDPVPNCVPKEKGVDDEEDRTETDDDFNPGNTPDNLDMHPHDEAEWQEDYDAEYGDEKATSKACEHTDHRGRPLNEKECPWCNDGGGGG